MKLAELLWLPLLAAAQPLQSGDAAIQRRGKKCGQGWLWRSTRVLSCQKRSVKVFIRIRHAHLRNDSVTYVSGT